MMEIVIYQMLSYETKLGLDVIQLYDIEQNGDRNLQKFEQIILTEVYEVEEVTGIITELLYQQVYIDQYDQNGCYQISKKIVGVELHEYNE